MSEITSVGEPNHRAPPGPGRTAADGPLYAAGVPVAEVPPLVEPLTVGFYEPAVEIRPPAFISRRPVRRRFLPPVAQTAGEPDNAAAIREARPSMLQRRPAPRLEAADRPLRQVEQPEPSMRRPRRGVAARPALQRRWRLALVAAGVATALVVATAFEVGVGVKTLARLPATILAHLRGVPLAPSAKPPADPASRVAFYSARAEAGDAASQVALAVLYAKGGGVRQDYAAAAVWFRRAAEQGVARAQYDLGVLCERGRGVPIDYAQAVRWYRKAAEQNHPLAQYNLAVAYTRGEGVAHNLSEAAVWYHRAAAHGVVAAMVNLAILYERGDGVAASTADAYAWYRAAAQRGSAPAARRADALLQGFSPWQQTQAEAKTTDVAASINDATGERERLTEHSPERSTAAVVSERSEPLLESGIDGGRATASGAAGKTP